MRSAAYRPGRVASVFSIAFLTLSVASAVLAVPVAAGTSSSCAGDCDGDGQVGVSELVTGVSIALGSGSLEECSAIDSDSSGVVDVSDLIRAINGALDGCPDPSGALFTIRACASEENPEGQIFHALIRDPAVIAEAESLIGAGNQKILSGRLLAGDGGFNAPWSWHLDPDAIGFAEVTIELCDGCPAFVEEELDYWLNTVGTYCPWTTEVVARER